MQMKLPALGCSGAQTPTFIGPKEMPPSSLLGPLTDSSSDVLRYHIRYGSTIIRYCIRYCQALFSMMEMTTVRKAGP